MPSTVAKEGQDSQGEGRWMAMHQRFVTETRGAEPEILWLGDGLIQNLFNSRIWETSFCLMHCLNFGISEDRTENVLWRLHNGELDNLSPKVIVLSVGQSNSGDTPEEIAEGIKEICAVIRSRQPQAFLVLLTLLPRGHMPNPLRERNSRVNCLLEELARGNSRLQLVDIDTGFVQVDQSISHHDMWDYRELTQKGYSKAFEPVNELLSQLISEMEGELSRPEAEGCAD